MNKVSAKELRRMFNTMMWPRLGAGELQVVRKKRVRARSPRLEPGTQTETIYLIERATNLRVAVCHRYVYPSGEKTPLDPKSILLDGQWWSLEENVTPPP